MPHTLTARDGASTGGQTRVVIVEDHHAIRAALVMLLDSCPDITVVGEAPSVGQACAVIAAQDPHLVLLDLRLGGQDGLDVARRLRASGSRTPVLVLSASDGALDLREALDAGADGFLSKSVPSRVLLDGVRRAAAGETVIGEELAFALRARAADPAPSAPRRLLGAARVL
ncbi:MAG TPA: response regulator transcription factor [Egibacteraceae bacterium]|jgi:DNA-binding NarL/FixJ family response regulator|nr:response regulator transcription factor [Egibacteraceae bacterium]